MAKLDKGFIESPSFFIINGSPTGFFSKSRGIRQGDPLSPYLFVNVMEFWSIGMTLSAVFGKLQPLKRGQEGITHLFFADDVLVFCKENTGSAKTHSKLLEDLHLNIGLQMNKNKSKLYLSEGCKCKVQLAQILGVNEGHLPIKYFELPSSIYSKAKTLSL